MEPPAIRRRRFGVGDKAPSGEAEGRPIRATQIGVRSFNFGQHWRTPGVREVSYRISLPLMFVAHIVGRELPGYMADCIAHPGTETLEDALRQRQWPGAEQVLNDPELCPLALSWFAHDCLIEWLGDGEPVESPGYVVNSVEMAERRSDEVRFEGTARAADQPVQYQDV